MTGVGLRNRASLSRKWDPDDYEWDSSTLKATKAGVKASKEGSRDSAWDGGDGTRAVGRAAVCQVQGCGRDLSEFKEYLQRYRICEYHRTLSCLVRNGLHQRFCQQCGKFQPLEEFDGEKRTCRSKLDRHNARRRKRRLKNAGGGSGRGARASAQYSSDEEEEEKQREEEGGTVAARNRSTTSTSTHLVGSELGPASPKTSPGDRSAALRRTQRSAARIARAAHGTRRARQAPQVRQGLESELSAGALQPAHSSGSGRSQQGTAAAPAPSPLANVLSQVASGGRVAQADLDKLLSMPLNDADAELAIQSVFAAWGNSEGANNGNAALADLLRPGRLAPMRMASVEALLSAVSLEAMDLDNLELGQLAALDLQRLPSILGQGSMPPGAPLAHSLVADAQLAAAAAPSGGLALQLQQPAQQQQAKPLTATVLSSSSPLSGLHNQQPQQPVAAAASVDPRSVMAPLQPLLPNYASTASSAQIPFVAAPAVAAAAAPGPSRLPAGPAATDECIAQGDEFDALLDELFKEDEPMVKVEAALANSGGGTVSAFASTQLPPLPAPLPVVKLTALASLSGNCASSPPRGPTRGCMSCDAVLTPRAGEIPPTWASPSWPAPLQGASPLCGAAQQQPFVAAQLGASGPTLTPVAAPAQLPGLAASPHFATIAAAAMGTSASALSTAVGMLSRQNAPQAVMQDRLVRLSLKMFNTTPDLLPSELRGEVMRLVSIPDTVVEGFLRPGCVHLTLNALLDPVSLEQLKGRGARRLLEALLAEPGMQHLCERPMLVQLGEELAVVEGGRVLQVVSLPGSWGVAPRITRVSPQVLSVHSMGGHSVVVRGANLVGPHHRLLCRHQGQYPLVEVVANSGPGRRRRQMVAAAAAASSLAASAAASGCSSPNTTLKSGNAATAGRSLGGSCPDSPATQSPATVDESDDEEWIEFRLPVRPMGLVEVEVARGAFLSGARPLLVLPCERAVAELSQLQTDTTGCPDPDGLLEGIGLVLRYLGGVTDQQQQQQQALSSPEVARLASAAGTATVLAAYRGWPAVARLVLPAVSLGSSPGNGGFTALDALCPPGQPFLHTAVASGSTELVELLGEWGRNAGLRWGVAAPGARGVTPLHLAALLRSPSLLKAVWALDPETSKAAWSAAHAEDGGTPAQYAQLAKTAQLGQTAMPLQPMLAQQPAPLLPPRPVLTRQPSQPPQQQVAQLVRGVEALKVRSPPTSPGDTGEAGPVSGFAAAVAMRLPSATLDDPDTPCSSQRSSPLSSIARAGSSSSTAGSSCAPSACQGSGGLDMLLEAAEREGHFDAAAAEAEAEAEAAARKLAPVPEFEEGAWAAAGRPSLPLKPHVRPADAGAGPAAPEWVTREWAGGVGSNMLAVVAQLHAGLDEEARQQVEMLLRRF